MCFSFILKGRNTLALKLKNENNNNINSLTLLEDTHVTKP